MNLNLPIIAAFILILGYAAIFLVDPAAGILAAGAALSGAIVMALFNAERNRRAKNLPVA